MQGKWTEFRLAAMIRVGVELDVQHPSFIALSIRLERFIACLECLSPQISGGIFAADTGFPRNIEQFVYGHEIVQVHVRQKASCNPERIFGDAHGNPEPTEYALEMNRHQHVLLY
jgi:hypothetical protein